MAQVGLLSRTPIASLVLTEDGRVTWLNDAATRLFELPPQPDTTRLDDLFLELECASILAQLRFVLDPAHPAEGRLAATLRRHDRRTTPVDVHLARTGDGEVLAQVVDPPLGPSRSLLEQQRAFCDALMAMSALVREQVGPGDFYRTLLQHVIDVVPGAQAGTILLRRPDSDDFDFAAAEGFDLAALQEHALTAAELHCQIETPTAVIIHEVDNAGLPTDKAEWMRVAGRTDEIRSSVSAPVVDDGRAVAFLNVNSFERPDAFDATSVELTTIFSRLVGDLIGRWRADHDLRSEGESLRHLANHDALTGLPNRRRIEEVMMDAASESFGNHQSMALVFVDLDDFKAINDTHGHDAGDIVLQATARRLAAATRGQDIVGRWGGDEFIIVAQDVDSADNARALGERVLAACPPELTLPDGHVVACQMSIGIAWSGNGSEGLWAMLRRADDALYQAKQAGKGVVCVAR